MVRRGVIADEAATRKFPVIHVPLVLPFAAIFQGAAITDGLKEQIWIVVIDQRAICLKEGVLDLVLDHVPTKDLLIDLGLDVSLDLFLVLGRIAMDQALAAEAIEGS